MRSFLGVPLLVAGEPLGNLYLSEKPQGEEFSEADEQALVRLAEFAGMAINDARRYSGVDEQRSQLNRTVQALAVTVQSARGRRRTDLETILELVANRGGRWFQRPRWSSTVSAGARWSWLEAPVNWCRG